MAKPKLHKLTIHTGPNVSKYAQPLCYQSGMLVARLKYAERDQDVSCWKCRARMVGRSG